MEKIEFQLFGSLKKRIVYRIVKKPYNKKPLDNQGVLVVGDTVRPPRRTVPQYLNFKF
jgi:hypothetical protein